MSNKKWDEEKNLTLTSWKVWEFVPFTTNVPVPKVVRTMGNTGKDNEVNKLIIHAANIITIVGTKSKRAVMAMSKS